MICLPFVIFNPLIAGSKDWFLTSALYTVRTCEFKQMLYEMYQADYYLKHFKLVKVPGRYSGHLGPR